MTIRELIEALQKIPNQEAQVTTEGCDCIGDVGSVEDSGDSVYLKRS